MARPPAVEADRSIEWYYIAPPAVGVVLIIIILGVILYFVSVFFLYCTSVLFTMTIIVLAYVIKVGFFQRKKHSASDQEENTDEGVAQFVENPFGDKK